MQILIAVLLTVTSLFLIVLVLIQRGKGGGLAGAFGGMGGQSAFGTKAGDMFTRVTMVVATFWILLCVFSFSYLTRAANPLAPQGAAGANAAGTEEGAGGGDETGGEGGGATEGGGDSGAAGGDDSGSGD